MGTVANKSRDIVLVDSHCIFLDGLIAILHPAGYQVVATATSWAEATKTLKERKPQLVIVETALSDSTGATGIPLLISHSPRTLVVVLTSDESASQLNAALAVGAAGYIHKTRNSTVLLNAISRVLAGEIVIEGSFMRDAFPSDPPPAELAHLVRYLTPRERECLAHLAAGHDTAVIAEKLGVSRTTVRTHVQSVLVKLGVHSRLEAAALASRYGLVDQQSSPDHSPSHPNGRGH